MSISRRQLEALGEPFGECATQPKLGGGYICGGGDSPPSAPTQTSTVSIPEYAKPYMEETLGKASAITDINQNPYKTYGGQQQAGFNPLQQQAFGNIQQMQSSPATGQAMNISSDVAQQSQQYGQYQPQEFGNQFRGAQFRPMSLSTPKTDYATTQSAQLGYAPDFSGMSFQGPQDVSAMQTQAERVSGPSLQNYQMGPAQAVSSKDFTDPNVASQYMNPYAQNVVDIQQREAQRAADIAKTKSNAQAVSSGAFGGSRQAIVDAEAARNLAIQKGDIQAAGLNAAYNQAQQAFQADQARALQAQQANQQAGLTVGQQNLGANLQTQGLGAQLGQQAGLANQQLGLQSALANQQTGLQAGLANQQMQYNTGLQNAQFGQQAGLANQALLGQYGLQQGQFNQAANLANQQANQQALLANQQAALQTQGQGLQQNLAGNAQAAQNAQLRAQYGLSGQQAGEQSRQFGANLGIQGLQQQLSAAGQLGNLGQQDYTQNMGINQAQQAAGAQIQQTEQQRLNQQYQNFLEQQNYPYKQLGFMSDLLRGSANLAGTGGGSIYQQPPSALNQIVGPGLLGLGAYKAMS